MKPTYMHEYDTRLAALARDVANIREIVALYKHGEPGRATLTTLWRFGWRA